MIFDIKKFERAVDRNVIYYDADAKPGEFTLRHLAILKVGGRLFFNLYPNKPARFKKIWLPKEIIDFIQDRDIERDDPHDHIYGDDFDVIPEGTQDLFLNKYHCSLQSQDKYLCFMEFDNGEYLLGSF